jgi:riboflavin kinase/FMN adenylyltransferase
MRHVVQDRVYAIGMFDGVHAGHRAMLALAEAATREQNPHSPLHVLTFHPHPRTVLAGAEPGLLCSLERRISLLEAAGVDHVEVQAFTTEFAAMSAERFIEHYLVERLRARAVVVGSNFRFGHEARGDVAMLAAHGSSVGIDVRICDLAVDAGQVVSSSRIRDLLLTRDVRTATRLLGRGYDLDGVVVHGARRGRELGYPTANLRVPSDRLVPADGVYAGRARTQTASGMQEWNAAISIGTNPQFDPAETAPRSIEAYLLDYSGADELYDRHLTIEFVEFIRGQATFPSVDALVVQMQRDVDDVRSVLVN